MKIFKPRKSLPLQALVIIVMCSNLSFAQTMSAVRLEEVPLSSASNPIINKSTFTNLNVNGSYDGSNINGASLISVPSWVPTAYRAHPLANYYLYFAHHGGRFIRMAWSSTIEGPWQLFNYGTASGRAWGTSGDYSGKETPQNGVLDLAVEKDDLGNPTNRIQPHSNYYALGHIASPDVHVDHANQRIIMFYHAPKGGTGASGQQTFVAISKYGLNFNKPQTDEEKDWANTTGVNQGTRAVIPGHFYYKAFQVSGEAVNPNSNDNETVQQWFAFSNRGVMYKAPTFTASNVEADLANSDEVGGLFNPTEDHPIGSEWWSRISTIDNPLTGIAAPLTLRDYETNVYGTQRLIDDRYNGPRHFAVFYDEAFDRNKIFVLYTGRADASESVVLVTLNLEGLTETERLDPKLWRKQHSVEKIVLTPEKEWEGGMLSGLYVSRNGSATNVKALRDPAIFRDTNGKIYLLYSGKGEEAIGIAQVNVIPSIDLAIKIYLQGAFTNENVESNASMRSSLSTLESFPLEGYDIAVTNIRHQEMPITNAMLNFSEELRPVDWVIVELRNDLTNVAYAKEAILLANGKIVDVDNSPVSFDGVAPGEFYVAVKHRNHLAVMSQEKIAIK